MNEAGLSQKTLRMVAEVYNNFQCSAFIAGEWGEWFVPQRGVHQGAPLSMRLYQVYINELISLLKRCPHGLIIDHFNLTCPSFMDDVATGALYKPGLNHLLRIAYEYSVKWLFEFSLEKSVWMLWGVDMSPNVSVKLGEVKLKRVHRCKHVGVTLCSENITEKDIIAEKIGEGRAPLMAARGLGSSAVPVPPAVLSKLYWCISVTRMVYGIEVKPINDTMLREFEDAHRQHAKIIQGLPSNIPSPAPLATLGWVSIKSYVAIVRLCFLWRILCLPNDNIYKRMVTHILRPLLHHTHDVKAQKRSPVANMYALAQKYHLHDLIINGMGTNDFGEITQKKKLIKNVVNNNEHIRWSATCMLYRGLSLYMETATRITMHAWWKFASRVPHLTKKSQRSNGSSNGWSA